MARKQKAYSVNTAKKVITLYSNIKQTDADKMVIDTYIRNGYVIKQTEKKTITVKQMRKELSVDEKALNEFNALYDKDTEKDEAIGFHQACKYYTNWKKEQEKKKKESKKTTEE